MQKLIKQYCTLDEDEIGDYAYKHIQPKLTSNSIHHYDDLFMDHVSKQLNLSKSSTIDKRYCRYRIPEYGPNVEIVGYYQHQTSHGSRYRYLLKTASMDTGKSYLSWMD